MKPFCLLFFALFLQTTFYLSAQENSNRLNLSGSYLPLINIQKNYASDEKEVSLRSRKIIEEIFQEPESIKIYIHLDRTVFLTGDTIWFKAYLWNGYDQIPDRKSVLLYADLLGPNGKAVERKKLQIQYGTAYGEFNLPDNLNEGSYKICAYTNDRKNPGSVQPFFQTITINKPSQSFVWECHPTLIKTGLNDSLSIRLGFFEVDTLGDVRDDYFHNVNYSLSVGKRIVKQDMLSLQNSREKVISCNIPDIQDDDSLMILNLSTQLKNRNIQNQFFIPLDKQPDIQFLPEGGIMVNGLESKVAFKAIGFDGLSCEVKGEIRNKDGDRLLIFESSHKGMGSFKLTPLAGDEYEAFVEYEKINYRYPLPKALDEGSVITLEQSANDSIYTVLIQCSPSRTDRIKYLAGTSYGKLRYISEIKTQEGKGQFTIPRDSFPEGIARITLLNDLFKPECERLIYVDNDQRINFLIVPDSLTYGQRSNVNLVIKTYGAGFKPVETGFSLAVLDAGLVITDDIQSGICSYKLLESELRGFIEEPGFYFQQDGSIRKKELDLLLLTQGYRNISQRGISIVTNKFDQEDGFNISGRVELRASEKRKEKYIYPEIGLSLLILDRLYIDKGHPDEQGNFQFHIPFMYGKPDVFVQAHNSNGRPIHGDIFLDQISTEPQLPLLEFKPAMHSNTYTNIEFIEQMQVSRKTAISKISNGVSMFMDLPEVTIIGKGRNKTFNYEKEAFWISNLDSFKIDGENYDNIYRMLGSLYNEIKKEYDKKFPGDTTKRLDFGNLIFILNGAVCYTDTHMEMLKSYYGSEIKRIMVIAPGEVSAEHSPKLPFEQSDGQGNETVIVVDTYAKGLSRTSPRYNIMFPLEGLDISRKFYSPRYDKPRGNRDIYDGRATLYWNPYILTNSEGLAKVDFYTSDRTTQLIIIANGMDKYNGNPGEGSIKINVK